MRAARSLPAPLKRAAVSVVDGLCRVEGAARRPAALALARRLVSRGYRKLHCGCGFVLLPGWVNIDLRSWPQHIASGSGLRLSRRPDLYADLREGLPFEDEAATHVYSNNFLEHLRREEALRHLRESFRVLEPGGRIRIVVPDVALYAKAYVDGDLGFFEDVAAASPYWPSWCRTPLEHLLTISHGSEELGWIHRWGYDYDTLAAHLGARGFRDVRRQAIGESDDPQLRGIDGEPKACLAVEAMKPARGTPSA